MTTTIISGFPGIGKSFFFDTVENVSDSDSSKFPKENFPENYIQHIKNLIGEKSIVLVSSHKVVRDALKVAEIGYTLVYPDRSLKQEYLERYRKRGNTGNFIKLVEENWENWISEIEQEVFPVKVVLKAGEFLSDLFK